MTKKRHTTLSIILLLIGLLPYSGFGQAVEGAAGLFYDRYENRGVEPQKYMPLRAADVVWEHMIWRTIDLNEKWNHFFYFPTEPEGSQGLLNFTYLIWYAARNNEIPIFEDDEFKIPIDNDLYFTRYTQGDTVQLEIYDDEEGEEFHYETVVIPKIFYSEDIKKYSLKEACYIEKQSTDQYVRLIGLAMIKDNYRTIDGEEEYIGSFPLFWIPFESMNVRRVLVRHEAYYEENLAHLPTWDYIFQSHFYSSFITRETNRFNRSISDYLTGQDAMFEAERIEYKLLDIEQDMWEF